MMDASEPKGPRGPLHGIRVLDLSRILAGPTCTQALGDLGATVLKIENPVTGGDDTRQWGPPYLRDLDGTPTDLSAYFMSANRNKHSLAVDITSKAGQDQIKKLAQGAHILVENFKPGGLEKYGLGFDALAEVNPALVYGSISGFGQTGPNRDKPGYDLMAQGYGGIMSLTGAPEGEPMKVGVGIADVMCGMYATIGLLAALRHAEATGQGQHVEVALVDAQIAWMINEGVNYLTTGEVPQRRGNGHPNIVPYGVYATADGHAIIAVGNDAQFGRFLEVIGLPELAQDARFATNPARLTHRDALAAYLEPAVAALSTQTLIAALEARKVPVGPVQTLDQVFASEQVAAREMQIDMHTPGTEVCRLIGNPLKLSQTPITYRYAPPRFGADTARVFADNPWETPDDPA